MPGPQVLIIGAGAAGIAAASKLMANNIRNIKILEAEDRIGGRIFTSEFGKSIVELGAQWVHGEKNNVVHSLGTSASLLENDSSDLYKSTSVLSDGSCLEQETVQSIFFFVKEIISDEEKISKFQGSLGDYVNLRLNEELKKRNLGIDNDSIRWYLDWYHKFQNSIDAADSWFETSAPGTVEYHECEGNSLTCWKNGGYYNIFNLLMGQNGGKIKENIIFNKTVKRIKWDRKPVEVLCEDGETLVADYVLVTVSLGVLKHNVSSLFVPSLPTRKLQAIEGLGFGVVGKIFLQFPYRWWPTECPGFNLLWKENDAPLKSEASWLRGVFGFYNVDYQPEVMGGWLVGQSARDMEHIPDQLVLEGCYQLLQQFLGKRYNIPFPVAVIRSKWYCNPHFRGTYSFRSVQSDKLDVSAADLASPLCLPSGQPVVLFGGEATHDHFYSTVHGAVETGWREAERLIKLSSPSTDRLPKSSL